MGMGDSRERERDMRWYGRVWYHTYLMLVQYNHTHTARRGRVQRINGKDWRSGTRGMGSLGCSLKFGRIPSWT